MRVLLWALVIFSFVGAYLGAKVRKVPIDKLGLHTNYNEVVRDLIKNWESPIVYLRQLGYLPSDYKDTSRIKPNLDALISRMDRDDEREALSQETDKSKQLFCGTQEMRKKKRDNVKYQIEKTDRHERAYDLHYPSVDELLAMKQPSLAVAMSAAKVDELMPKQKPANQQDAKLLLLTQLLGKQQPAQLQPQSEKSQQSDDFLQRLVAKTSPEHTVQLAAGVDYSPQVAAGTDHSPQVAAQPIAGPPAMHELLDENTAKRTAGSLVTGVKTGLGDTSSLSTYGTLFKPIDKLATHSSQFSRPAQAQSEIPIKAPQYLNWDIANNRLKQSSPLEKNTYVEKLVQIYVKKQENLDHAAP